MSSLTITRSNTLIWVDPGDTLHPRLVPRYFVTVDWVHSDNVVNLDKFELSIHTSGGDPVSTALMPTTFVGGTIREAVISIAPLMAVTARVSVRAYYLDGNISAWRTLGSDLAIGGTLSTVALNGVSFTGATSVLAGMGGQVPAPAAGQQTQFLRGDGTWAGAGGMRSTVTITTASLAANAEVTGSFTVPKTSTILNLTNNYPARVRIYLSSTQRDADLSRDSSVDPTGNHGCVLETVTVSGTLALDLSPVAILGTPSDGTTAYYAIKNLDSTSRVITTTLAVLSMEG